MCTIFLPPKMLQELKPWAFEIGRSQAQELWRIVEWKLLFPKSRTLLVHWYTALPVHPLVNVWFVKSSHLSRKSDWLQLILSARKSLGILCHPVSVPWGRSRNSPSPWSSPLPKVQRDWVNLCSQRFTNLRCVLSIVTWPPSTHDIGLHKRQVFHWCSLAMIHILSTEINTLFMSYGNIVQSTIEGIKEHKILSCPWVLVSG